MKPIQSDSEDIVKDIMRYFLLAKYDQHQYHVCTKLRRASPEKVREVSLLLQAKIYEVYGVRIGLGSIKAPLSRDMPDMYQIFKIIDKETKSRMWE